MGLPGRTAEFCGRSIADFRKAKEVVVSGGAREVPAGFFAGCALYKVDLQPGVQRVGEGAFRGCFRLVSVRLPEGLVELGSSCFEGA